MNWVYSYTIYDICVPTGENDYTLYGQEDQDGTKVFVAFETITIEESDEPCNDEESNDDYDSGDDSGNGDDDDEGDGDDDDSGSGGCSISSSDFYSFPILYFLLVLAFPAILICVWE